MKTWLMIPVLAAAWTVAAFAGDAKSAFDAGNYAEAAKQLEGPVLGATPSAENFYNLALASEKAGDPVKAALNYQRALLLDPGLKPARNAFALLAAAHHIPLPPRTWRDDLDAVAHPDTWVVLGAALAWIGAFGLLLALRLPKRGGVTALAVLAMVAGGAMLVAGGMGDNRMGAGRPAVVTAKEGAEVLAAPANNSDLVVALPAGTPVDVRSPRGAWAYVDVAGAKGWVQTKRLTPMVPGEVF